MPPTLFFACGAVMRSLNGEEIWVPIGIFGAASPASSSSHPPPSLFIVLGGVREVANAALDGDFKA